MTAAVIDSVIIEALVSGTGTATVDSVLQEVLVSGTATAYVDGVFVETLVATIIPGGPRRPPMPRSMMNR